MHITQLVSRTNPRHEGWHFVRTIRDSFTVKGPFSDHICLVFEPLLEPLWLLKDRFEGNSISSELLKIMVQMMLHGLGYVHQVCHTVHTGRNVESLNRAWKPDQHIHMTDLIPDNVMARLDDKSILEIDTHDNSTIPSQKSILLIGRSTYREKITALQLRSQ